MYLLKEYRMNKWSEYVIVRIAVEMHFVMRQLVIWCHCKDSKARRKMLTLSNEVRKIALKAITD
jgi:hypothetical protein